MSDASALHPRPAPDAPGREFWDAARERRLVLQRCDACDRWRHPPAPVCPACHDATSRWEEVGGTGTIHTYTVCHPPVLPAFADQVPYVAVVVELDEGPLMVSRLVDHEDVDVRIGRPVAVTFQDVDDGLTLPLFRPRA